MPREPEWRAATAADLPALLELIDAAYRGREGWASQAHLVQGGGRVSAAELEQLITAPRTLLLVVPEPEGRSIVACARIRDAGGGVTELGLFAVDPARQSGGIGRAVVALARRLAVERLGADTLEISVLEPQRGLIDWYERQGFRTTGDSHPFPVSPRATRARSLVGELRFIVMRAPARGGPLALSWSGGKDSALALQRLRSARAGAAGPEALVTTVTETYGRVSMHGVRRELLATQAAAVGLPLVEVAIAAGASNADYEAALAAALARPPLDRVAELAFGDLFLADIRAYREAQCAAAGRHAAFPLWHLDTGALARRFIADGFRARVVCLDPARLDPSLAGRAYDAAFLADLPGDVDPCGENGEFHTFVHAGPGFAAPIPIRAGEVVARDGFVFADLLPG